MFDRQTAFHYYGTAQNIFQSRVFKARKNVLLGFDLTSSAGKGKLVQK